MGNISTANSKAPYGRSGRYDKVPGGMKAFGNPTQWDSQVAIRRSASEPECTPKEMYIAVWATVDNASLTLNVTSVAFTDTP